jgi:hypothetical protein
VLGDADAHGHRHAAPAGVRLHALAQALGERVRSGRAGAGEEEGELLAADAREQVVGALVGQHDLRRRPAARRRRR